MSDYKLTPEKINVAREWLATVQSVGRDNLEPQIQEIVDTIDQSLEWAMERVLEKRQEPKPSKSAKKQPTKNDLAKAMEFVRSVCPRLPNDVAERVAMKVAKETVKVLRR